MSSVPNAAPSSFSPPSRGPRTGHEPILRVAAVWGTTVIGMKTLERGESLTLDEGPEATFLCPDGARLPKVVAKGLQGGWELDARGVTSGLLRLRGREEDPMGFARSGSPVPVVPGDFGVLQYGLFSLFFQYVTPAKPLQGRYWPELLTVLAIFSSCVLHVGALGMLRALMTPPPLAKPAELTSPEEYAARFNLHRPLDEEVPPAGGGDSDKSKGVKDPGAQDKKATGGGQKIKGAEGKMGLHGDAKTTEIPGEARPTIAYGGLSDVLTSEAGNEIKNTLKSINTVANALGGLNSANLVLGTGPGTSLKGGGAGGGGTGAGIAFGAGTLNTGWGAGNGGGMGAGAGGVGRGAGGPGTGGGGGGGGGAGGGAGPGEARVAVTAGAGNAHGGLTMEQVRRVVMARTGALRACYETEAQRNPSLRGGVTLVWRIDPSGSVQTASIGQSSLNSARAEGCFLRQVKGWHFPASESATPVEWPFKFGVGG